MQGKRNEGCQSCYGLRGTILQNIKKPGGTGTSGAVSRLIAYSFL